MHRFASVSKSDISLVRSDASINARPERCSANARFVAVLRDDNIRMRAQIKSSHTLVSWCATDGRRIAHVFKRSM